MFKVHFGVGVFRYGQSPQWGIVGTSDRSQRAKGTGLCGYRKTEAGRERYWEHIKWVNPFTIQFERTFLGGAVFPSIQALISDATNIHFSYTVPLVCLVVVAIFGATGAKLEPSLKSA